jgi:hypothetical protein
LTGSGGTGLLIRARQGFRNLMHKAAPGLPEIIHRTSFYHCLQRPSIDFVVVDTPAELRKSVVRSFRISFSDE